MRVFALLATILSSLALASAAALPATKATTAAHLVYGDIQLDLKLSSCQTVPQNKDDGLPKPSLEFTSLKVNSGHSCQLFRYVNFQLDDL